jgi:hypothetical protein
LLFVSDQGRRFFTLTPDASADAKDDAKDDATFVKVLDRVDIEGRVLDVSFVQVSTLLFTSVRPGAYPREPESFFTRVGYGLTQKHSHGQTLYLFIKIHKLRTIFLTLAPGVTLNFFTLVRPGAYPRELERSFTPVGSGLTHKHSQGQTLYLITKICKLQTDLYKIGPRCQLKNFLCG